MSLDKTIRNYAFITAGAFLFDKIYALFGHGVSSPWMSNMYLYLLVLGVAVFALLRIFTPDIASRKGCRLFFNLYNSGLAALINGMLLYGILDIAGGTSQIVPWFLYIGSALMAAAAVLFVKILAVGHRRHAEVE
jgi:hypothetical protein